MYFIKIVKVEEQSLICVIRDYDNTETRQSYLNL